MVHLINSIRLLKTHLTNKCGHFLKNSFTQKYLFYTNVGISIVLSGMGDILEQHYEILYKEMDGWDKTRTRNMSVSGMTVGIICHHWYRHLDRLLPGFSLKTVMKKILVDQVVCSPLTISAMFITVGILERKQFKEICDEIKQKMWILYVAEWVVWPPAQFINFYFLPTKYRVLYDNTISLGYDVYTSYVKHKDLDQSS